MTIIQIMINLKIYKNKLVNLKKEKYEKWNKWKRL